MLPPPHLRGDGSISGPHDPSNDDFRNNQQQYDGDVNADGIAGDVYQSKSPVEKGSDEMDEQVRKAKGITSDHPVPVAVDPFLFDLRKRRYADKQPDDIQRIKRHAA